MINQSLRSSACRMARLSAIRRPLLARSFIIPTAVNRSPDVVQDLYLKELKAYKIPPIKDSDSQGQVKVWSEPKTREPPALMTQNEQDISTYKAQTVDVEDASTASAEDGSTQKQDDDWFEEDVAFEEEKPAHH